MTLLCLQWNSEETARLAQHLLLRSVDASDMQACQIVIYNVFLSLILTVEAQAIAVSFHIVLLITIPCCHKKDLEANNGTLIWGGRRLLHVPQTYNTSRCDYISIRVNLRATHELQRLHIFGGTAEFPRLHQNLINWLPFCFLLLNLLHGQLLAGELWCVGNYPLVFLCCLNHGSINLWLYF